MTENLDLFTMLPDCILFLIISLLPFKDAARTCILSKRWCHVWRATKNLEFNENFFVKHNEPENDRDIQKQSFIDFMRQWLENYQEPVMDRFFLKFSSPENFWGNVEGWIAFAIQHNVKDLGLDFSDPTWDENNMDVQHVAQFDLPPFVYMLRTLESIHLFSCNFRMPDLINFSALKEVSFGWMELRAKIVKALFENCNMLERLSLKHCWNLDHFYLSGVKPRLKILVLDKCQFENEWVGIEAPNLRFFKYSGVVAAFDLEVGRNMEEADIDFGVEDEFNPFGQYLYNLLETLYTTRVLTVCSYTLQIISTGYKMLHVQSQLNVKHLIMKTQVHENEFYGIRLLLYSCPYLQTLAIELGHGRIFADYDFPFLFNPTEFWVHNVMVYSCLKSSLKVVEVKGFRGKKNEFFLLNYLIQCGRVMERMNINVSSEVDADENMELYKLWLQGAPRGSPSLQISIC